MKYQRVRRVMKEASRERERRRTCWEEREESSILKLRTQQTLGWLCNTANCSVLTDNSSGQNTLRRKTNKVTFFISKNLDTTTLLIIPCQPEKSWLI